MAHDSKHIEELARTYTDAGSSQRSVIPISDYTVVNLKEIENSAGDNAALEAHFGRKHLDSEHLGVSHFRANPGFRSEKGHSHREQEEVYIVVTGSGRIKQRSRFHLDTGAGVPVTNERSSGVCRCDPRHRGSQDVLGGGKAGTRGASGRDDSA